MDEEPRKATSIFTQLLSSDISQCVVPIRFICIPWDPGFLSLVPFLLGISREISEPYWCVVLISLRYFPRDPRCQCVVLFPLGCVLNSRSPLSQRVVLFPLGYVFEQWIPAVSACSPVSSWLCFCTVDPRCRSV